MSGASSEQVFDLTRTLEALAMERVERARVKGVILRDLDSILAALAQPGYQGEAQRMAIAGRLEAIVGHLEAWL